MFARNLVGFGSPFQQHAVSNPFQLPTVGYPPTINPFLIGSGFSTLSPLASQIGGFGISPYAGLQPSPFNPITSPFASQIAAGLTPAINPVPTTQLATTNPVLLSHLAQQSAVQPNLAWAGQWGTPFGAINPNILAQVIANPALVNDPVVGPLVAQQLSPFAGQQLPIRPLIGAHQFEPFQSGITGSTIGQGVDPYSAFVQAQLISQQAASPLQQILRAYSNTPWVAGQVFPYAQAGLPFGY